MVIMVFFYMLVFLLVGFIGIMFLFELMIEVFYSLGWISYYVVLVVDVLL